MELIVEFLPTSRHKPVCRYGSEKSIVFARSAVAVIDDMMRSIFFVCSDGINPSKGRFCISTSRPRDFPSSFAKSTLTPAGWPFSSVISNGGYFSSMPTTNCCRGFGEHPQPKMPANRIAMIQFFIDDLLWPFRAAGVEPNHNRNQVVASATHN